MCGILGSITKRGIDIKSMAKILSHRGPDDEGFYFKKYDNYIVNLAHRRLSIIDLSLSAHQPMSNEDKTIWITYNGEIYNFYELKKELEQKSHIFQSKSDTEVIIHAYEEWGIDCLNKFNGMFAFAIWDEKKKQLFIARDRFGIKPLYYAYVNNNFIFASEIKAILKSGLIKPEINFDVLPYYFAYLWVPGPQTMFKNIFKLLPGHYMLWKNDKVEIKEYWDLRPQKYLEKSENAIAQELLEKMKLSVEREMVSDVPIGAFLSGGIDSSIIVSLMSQISKKRINTFTIAVELDKKLEDFEKDLKFARILKNYLGDKLNYKEIFVKPDIIELLPKLIWHLEEPIADPAIITAHLISQTAKSNGITVMLSGMASDEIFAGYNRHKLAYLLFLFDKYGFNFINKFLKILVKSLPLIPYGPSYVYLRYLKRMADYFDKKEGEKYIGISSWLSKENVKNLLMPLRKEIKDFDIFKIHLNYFNKYKNSSILYKMLYTDIKTFLVDLNLTYTDKMSMANSIEVRVPYLDYELIDYVFKIPNQFKLYHFHSKYILKKAGGDILPKEIINRKKVPFGLPIREWFDKLQKENVFKEIFDLKKIKKDGYFNSGFVRDLIKKANKTKSDSIYNLWAILTFQLWYKIFIENRVN